VRAAAGVAVDDSLVAVVVEQDSGGGLSAARALARLRDASPFAVYVAAASVAVVVAGYVVLAVDGRDLAREDIILLVVLGAAGASCAALGALILAQQDGNRLGLAFLVGGFGTAVWSLATAVADASNSGGSDLVRWVAWLDNWVFVGLIVLVTWPLLLYPTGTLPSRRWRPLGALLLAATTAIALAGMLDRGELGNVAG